MSTDGDYQHTLAQRAAKRKLARDIGEIPKCVDPERRKYLEAHPAEWLREILPNIYTTEFSKSQLVFIDLAWGAIVNGTCQNIEAYRGLGKTSILYGLVLLAVSSGVLKHVLVITAEGGSSVAQATQWFVGAIEDDYGAEGDQRSPYHQYYPEIAFPIQKREGSPIRPVWYKGSEAGIVIKTDRICFPQIWGYNADDEPTPSCGAMIRCTSITSGDIRGANHIIKRLGSYRVRAVILDDIQSDAGASSAAMVTNIINTIDKSVRLLSGRSKTGGKEPLTILSAITQNAPNDVACVLANKPDMNTIILPFVTRLPDNWDAWYEYKQQVAINSKNIESAKDKQKSLGNLKKWFKANIDKFKGVEVDDERLYEPWQYNAVHYAVHRWSESQLAFWSELQNDAERAYVDNEASLNYAVMGRKLRRNANNEPLRRCWIPEGTSVLTAHIDVGEHYCNYEVCAFSHDFNLSHVVDFDITPEQDIYAKQKRTYQVDLQDYYEGPLETQIEQCIEDTVIKILEQQYFDSYGNPISIDADTEYIQHGRVGGLQRPFKFLAYIGVDCSDGEREMGIWRACNNIVKRQSHYMGRIVPSYGDAAGSKLIRYWDLKPGEWRRDKRLATPCDWIENPDRCKSLHRRFTNVPISFLYDANTSKTRCYQSWEIPVGRDGSTTIYWEEDKDRLDAYTKQLTAETFVQKKKSGIDYKVWSFRKPQIYDNEFLDCHVACRAHAEYVGCSAILN